MSALRDSQFVFLLAINLLVLAVGAAISGGTFVEAYNLQSMAGQLPEIGLLALGVTLAMCAGNGGIDLSGIALANLAGVFAAIVLGPLMAVDDAPWLFTLAFIAVTVTVGAVGGWVNGLLIARVGLTPILCTLGTQLLFAGLAVVLSGGPSVRVGSAEPLMALGNDSVLGLPISFLVYCACLVAVGLMLTHAPTGQRLLLMGTNPVAARFAGFRQDRLLILTYTLSGALAGVAGVLIASRNVNVKWDYGQSYLLIAILITVMAGVRPEGGYGRITCLFLSTTALQLLSSVLNFADLSNFFRDFAWGALLLLFLAVTRADLATWWQRQKPPGPVDTSRPGRARPDGQINGA